MAITENSKTKYFKQFLSFEEKMVNLRRSNRNTRGSGFSTRYLSLLIAATMALVLWAYQRIYFDEPALWLLIIAIIMAVMAFGLAIYHIVSIWRNRRRQNVNP